MREKKKGRRRLFGAAIATVLVLVIVPLFLMSQQPTGQAVANNQQASSQQAGNLPAGKQPASNQIIPQSQPQQPSPQQPVTQRDVECRAMNMDFNTCMEFLYLLCFSNADCGPFTCQGNKCVP